MLAACLPVTRPTVKIALVAPFEGRYRDVGYEVIYAVRLAVQEANRAGGVAGYSVELIALDDGGDPEQATAQARKVAADPAVLGAIGHWLDETTIEAAPEYAASGIAFLATTSAELHPSAFRLWPTDADLQAAAGGGGAIRCTYPCGSLEDLGWLTETRDADPEARIFGPPLWGQPQFAALAGDAAKGVYLTAPAPLPADSTDPGFADRYRRISNGVEPRAYAVLAYDAARVLFDAIARSAQAGAEPTRPDVLAALPEINFDGLSGVIQFDDERNWEGARGWVYQWREGEIVATGQPAAP